MAKDKSLKQGPAPDAFAEGAARFAELARTVKAQQAIETQGEPGAESRVQITSPDEVWATKYMSHAIGPWGTDAGARFAPVPHATALVPDFSGLKRSYKPAADRARGMGATYGLKPAPMAVRLGREDRPRRSWLVRLWRGAR